jgi:uncharacterized protein YjbJ (UPF0337 family)
MGDRIDELKGNVKEGAGKMTGNTEMEAEGRGEKTLAQGRREVKGAANQIKGNIEQGVGRLTDDDSTRAQGMADQAKGNAERTG